MEWQTEVKQLYDNMVLKIPEALRPIVSPVLFEKTEERCSKRNGKEVAESDLIVALYEVTPPPFQPTMTADLESFGVDYEKYLLLVKGGFKHQTDLNQLVEDIKRIGEFTGVKCNEEVTWKALNAYKDFFSGSSISMRTTTKPVENRDISVRYVELMIPHNPDPYTTAINAGLLEKNDKPIHKMMAEIDEKHDILGYGVDVDVRKGLSKLWTLLVPSPIEAAYSMSTFPESVKKTADHFAKFGLNSYSLYALDFLHTTMNIYVMIKDASTATPEKYRAILEDLGFNSPSPEVIEKCCDARTIYYTFNWDSDVVERVCFGMVCFTKEEVPVQFHPIMKEFVDKAPFTSDLHRYIYSIAFSRKGDYMKVENDYNGTMIELLLMSAEAGIIHGENIQEKLKVKNKMDTKEEWEKYLTSFMVAYNELPELKPILGPNSPLVFQYVITDRPEMNFWQSLEKDQMAWGMGEYLGPDAPKIFHKTDFDTIKKVNSGESDPIQATMAGTYVVEGDITKLMACAPLVPLNAKAHANAAKK